MSELITEQVPDFLHDDYDLPTLYRYDTPYGRVYYKIQDDEIIYGVSVTTVTSSEVPKGERLIEATADRGYNEMREYMQQEGYYGTILDILFHQYQSGIAISLHEDDLKQFIIQHLSKPRSEGGEELDVWEFPKTLNSWPSLLQKHLWGLKNWAEDYQYEPHMVQTCLMHDELRYAGAVDDYGVITEPNNRGGNEKGRESKVLIDLKKSVGVYRDRVFQQSGYKGLIEYNFDETPERYFILAPNARSKQGYSFNEITNHPDMDGFRAILYNYTNNPKNMELRDIVKYSGTLSRNSDEASVEIINVLEHLKERHGL